MNMDELLEALLSELKEYGEVMIPTEELAEYPAGTSVAIADALRLAMAPEVLVQTYNLQMDAYVVKRTGEARRERGPRGTARFDDATQTYHYQNGWVETKEMHDRRRYSNPGARSYSGFNGETVDFGQMREAAERVAEAFRNMKWEWERDQ